ncbi:MAG: NAD(P)-dependent oxidoreductase [Methanobacterium sp.]
MKIFIIGVSGFIGSNLAKFYQQDNDIFYFSRKDNLIECLENFKPDLNFNCAAEIYNKDLMFASNVGIVHTCLEYVKDNPSTTLVHFGSSSEYGNEYQRATKEDDYLNVYDMYSSTKAAATVLCQGYGKTYNLDVVVIRPYSPYGLGEKPHRLFPSLWKSFMLDRPMSLTNGVHDFCYIKDFLEAVNCVIISKERTPGELINISTGVQYTNLEVLDLFKIITNKEGNVTVIDKFTTPEVWKADISHIQNKYGWSPKFSLENGIRDFIESASYE